MFSIHFNNFRHNISSKHYAYFLKLCSLFSFLIFAYKCTTWLVKFDKGNVIVCGGLAVPDVELDLGDPPLDACCLRCSLHIWDII